VGIFPCRSKQTYILLFTAEVAASYAPKAILSNPETKPVHWRTQTEKTSRSLRLKRTRTITYFSENQTSLHLGCWQFVGEATQLWLVELFRLCPLEEETDYYEIIQNGREN
jgi:hypothetical protein